MSQLSLSLEISDDARDTLKQFSENRSTRAVAIRMEGERLACLGAPIPSSDALAADLQALRSAIEAHGATAAFAFVRVGEGVEQVTIVPDTEPPKVKMLFASSSAHVRKALTCSVRRDHHVTSIGAVEPSLFAAKSTTEDVMTESEKANIAIAQMPVAPTGSALPGMGLALDGEAENALVKVKEGAIRAAAFAVEKGGASCVWSTSDENPVEAICREVGDAQPRYILLAWEGRTLFIYLCPAACKPRERMAYSVSKVAFTAQISKAGVEIAKSIETDTTEGLAATITEALKGGIKMEAVAPAASTMVKGPRMVFK